MKHSKHILVVSQYFYPESFRINDMCEEWVKRGYKVTVVTGIPNYPMGKIYDGYGYTKKRREQWRGIDIVRIPLIPRGNNSVGMIFNYLSFVFSGFFWKTFTKIKADTVFIYEVSPMTQALVGVWYAKKRKIPCYLYVQDLWPENVEIVTGIHSRLVLGVIGKMVDYIYRWCDRIFVTSDSFGKEIRKRGVAKDKVEYWPQYAEEFYQPMEKTSKSDAFVITFTGNIGRAQGLDILPKVAKILKEQNYKVRFKIVGDGRNKEAFIEEIEKKDVSEMFDMIGRKPAEEIPKILAESDAAFLSFMDNPLFAKTIPAKLQSYMACGVPIIASATGESKRIIEEAECGVCCPIGDAEQLANEITKVVFLQETDRIKMAKNARRYCEEHFDKKKLMDYMENYLV